MNKGQFMRQSADWSKCENEHQSFKCVTIKFIHSLSSLAHLQPFLMSHQTHRKGEHACVQGGVGHYVEYY